MTVLLRPAGSSRADAMAYAWSLNEAAHGLFAELFGRDWRRIIADMSLVPGHELSLEHVVFAEDGDTVLGACSGGATSAIPTGLLVRTLGWRVPRAAAVWMAGFPTTAWLTKRTPGDWYLQSIAVTRQARGQGVGSMLFSNAVERATAAGARRMVLDVRVGNAGAQRLYERLGMRVLAESPRLTLPGVHRVRRMGLDL